LVKCGQTAASERESDFGHIDLDQQRLLYKLVVAFVRIDSPLCWKDDSIDISIIGGVAGSWCSTKDAPALQTAVCLDSEIQNIDRRTVGGWSFAEPQAGVVGRNDMKPITQKRNEVVELVRGKPCSRTIVGFDDPPASR